MSEAVTDALADTPYIGIQRADIAGQVTLRAELTRPAAAKALDAATGLEMPDRLGVTFTDDARAVWMSPDELLLIVPDAGETVAGLEKALARQHHMALDVSDTRALFRLTGPAVAEVLAKGAPCDLSDRACPPGTARRTHLAGLAVGLWRLDAEAWEIVCFRSYAHHLEAWLHQAATPGAEVG